MSSVPEQLHSLLGSQRLGVLATSGVVDGPYTSLLAFAHSADLRSVFFATPRATRKYVSLKGEPRTAMLIDDRTVAAEGYGGIAITILGRVDELDGDAHASARKQYLAKHPLLLSFVDSPDTALCALRVIRYRLQRFDGQEDYAITQ